MTRYGCFEVKTSCGACGRPVPVNGPLRRLPCPSCRAPVSIDPDTLGGFLTDLEEEYDGLSDGQGSGGTLFSGAGNFEYGAWRLAPRCHACRKPLPEVATGTDGQVACAHCGVTHPTFPAPDWLVGECPSASQVIGGVRESTGDEVAPELTDAVEPVVMACPQCGGGLSVTAVSERIFACSYCQAQVFVPDPIWDRLHPVATVAEWFVRFEGRTPQQLQSEQRREDAIAEKAELRRWRRPQRRGRTRRWLAPVLLGAVGLGIAGLVGFGAAGAVMAAVGWSPDEIGEALGSAAGAVLVAAVLGVSVYFASATHLSFRFGRLGRCKRAMAELAERHGWEHDGAEYAVSMGTVRGKLEGVEFDLHPDEDYALEIDLDDSPFYVKTEPPGYPRDNMVRFTSGDARFDRWFPIRYATSEVAARLERSAEPLAPLTWFLDRWGDRIATLCVDSSDFQVHLAPGGLGGSDASRYLEPDVIEPLLRDGMVVAKGLVAVAHGNTPELPR